ncbi:ABC transporter substrate-binding protein [Paenibacillus sp. FSL R10-2736]|uniref:ABC transporter substrate-binding protein n=1 Tax=Paenibacillus sp. FSL R10-2736 TaxID=2954692 RepID=UPI0030F7D243
MRHSKQTTKQNRGLRLALTMVLLMAIMVIQACGGTGGNNGANASAPSPAAPEQPSGADNEPVPAAKKVPEKFTYLFVGATGKQSGAEGWGFHTGIIPEVLAQYGIKEAVALGGGTGPDINEALLAGRADVATTGDTPQLLTRAAGNKTKLIGFTVTQNESYLLGKKNGVSTVKELEDKTIAVVKGSIMHRYVVGLLKENNIKANIINMGWPDSYAALARGDIDAFAPAAYDYTSYRMAEEEGYPVLDRGIDHPPLLGTSVTVAREEFLNQYPDFLEAWNAARTAALEDLKSKPDEYYAYISEITGTPIDVAPILYPIELIADTEISEQGIERLRLAKDFLQEEKLAAGDFDLEQWIHN